MKYLMLIATALFVASSYVGEANGDEPKAPSRKVVQAPKVQVPNPKFTRPSTRPSTQRPLPKGFGVPIQRPPGFGKQQWQKPQQQPPQQQLGVQPRHNLSIYNYYTPVNPYFRYYRVPVYRQPVIIQPQPFPVYPAPFHGFFFQFRW